MNAPERSVIAAAPANASAVALLPIDEIIASPSNPRRHFDSAYLGELAESIKSHGVIQPITVRPLPLEAMFDFNKRRKAGDERQPRYEIVVGECRWRAAKRAGLTEIPGFWRELDDKQVLEIQVIENLQRRDVHPIEEAEGYQALIDRHGYTADQLAAKVGKSRSYIYGRLKFTALCAEARADFFAGTLEASTALLIARIPGEGLQKKALKEVTRGYNGEPLSYRAAKQHIHTRFTLNLKQATFNPADAELLPAAGACSSCPKRSGNFQDLFDDITDADVCTDPDCFEAKNQARRDRLIANAEKLKVPVITDTDLARRYFHNPDYSSLDDECEDDAGGRTYREILGTAAPVLALVQHPWRSGEMMEMAETTALEKALRKAGWTPAEEAPPPPPANESAENKAARLAKEAEDAATREARDAEITLKEIKADEETARRTRRRDGMLGILPTLELDVSDEADGMIRALVAAWLDNEIDSMGIDQYEDELRTWLGVELPEEYDEREVAPGIWQAIDTAPLGKLIGLVLDPMTRHGVKVHWTNAESKNPVLEIAAKALRLDGQPAAAPARPVARYAQCIDGSWQTWTGKGKRPAWVRAWIDQGGTLADLEAA